MQTRNADSRLSARTLLTRYDLHKIKTKAYLVRYHVAIKDLAVAVIPQM